MSRIVSKCNFDKDTDVEHFILWPMPHLTALKITDALNEIEGIYGARYYTVVDNDYTLYDGSSV